MSGAWLRRVRADQSQHTGYSGGALKRQELQQSVSDRRENAELRHGQYEKTDVFSEH